MTDEIPALATIAAFHEVSGGRLARLFDLMMSTGQRSENEVLDLLDRALSIYCGHFDSAALVLIERHSSVADPARGGLTEFVCWLPSGIPTVSERSPEPPLQVERWRVEEFAQVLESHDMGRPAVGKIVDTETIDGLGMNVYIELTRRRPDLIVAGWLSELGVSPGMRVTGGRRGNDRVVRYEVGQVREVSLVPREQARFGPVATVKPGRAPSVGRRAGVEAAIRTQQSIAAELVHTRSKRPDDGEVIWTSPSAGYFAATGELVCRMVPDTGAA